MNKEEKDIIKQIDDMLRRGGYPREYYINLNSIKRDIGTYIGHMGDLRDNLDSFGRFWQDYE